MRLRVQTSVSVIDETSNQTGPWAAYCRSDPAGWLVTLTGVEVSPDYAHAKVYFTTIGAPVEAAQQILNEKAGYFHSLLFKRLTIHTIPRLSFVHDESVSRGIEIDRLIEQANKNLSG